jgi:hypothetical protein
MPIHNVAKGEYLSLIALRYGVPWKKIWDDARNKDLRVRRKTPNILNPGDRIFVPEIELRHEECQTEKRHVFKQHRSKNKIRLVVRDEWGEPIPGLQYIVHIKDQASIKGKTENDGLVQADVPEHINKVQVVLPDLGEVLELKVGALDPISHLKGVQQRLTNLGFDPGPIDGVFGPRTRRALLAFQGWANLKQTGLADRETRKEIEKRYEGLSRGIAAEDSEGERVQAHVAGLEKGEKVP